MITALLLSFKLAFVTSIILLLLASPIAWWLANLPIQHAKTKALLEAIIALPLVLPPTVLGFYCLLAFSPDFIFGIAWQQLTGSNLNFSFSGLVIASVIYSLPFAVQPLQASFSQIPKQWLTSAASMGSTGLDRFRHIILPLSRSGFIAAFTLSFAHTLGEFGVVLMIGGNIPGETQVVSIALYDYVENLQFAKAHQLAATLLVIALAILSLTYWASRKQYISIGNNLSNNHSIRNHSS